MSYQTMQNSRTRRKENMIYVMGDVCQICGYHRSIHALEFHHINPEEKDFSFNKANSVAWDIIQPELQKCVLLCANCHREVHDGTYTKELKSSYHAERALEVKQRIDDLKTHKIKYCPTCGKIISNQAKLCEECSAIQRRKTNRPSRDELKQLIRSTPFLTIGKQFGVTDNAVRKWCDAYQLPRKVADIKLISDEDWSLI